MLIHNICFSLCDLLYSVWQTLGDSIFLSFFFFILWRLMQGIRHWNSTCILSLTCWLTLFVWSFSQVPATHWISSFSWCKSLTKCAYGSRAKTASFATCHPQNPGFLVLIERCGFLVVLRGYFWVLVFHVDSSSSVRVPACLFFCLHSSCLSSCRTGWPISA